MASVAAFVWPMVSTRPVTISVSVWPPAGTPSMYLSWLAAISSPDAVMKPEITGWLRKLATKPSRNRPMAISITPEISASSIAAAR